MSRSFSLSGILYQVLHLASLTYMHTGGQLDEKTSIHLLSIYQTCKWCSRRAYVGHEYRLFPRADYSQRHGFWLGERFPQVRISGYLTRKQQFMISTLPMGVCPSRRSNWRLLRDSYSLVSRSVLPEQYV
jgi:hypothetical protein